MQFQAGNLFSLPPRPGDQEQFDTLLEGATWRLERIVSTGQATPEGEWYDQPRAEWVVLLSGRARLRIQQRPDPVELAPGDWILLPAHCRHRVEWTTPDEASVWLALHFASTDPAPSPDGRNSSAAT